MKHFSLFFVFLLLVLCYHHTLNAQNPHLANSNIRCGADRTEEYMTILKDKRVGLVVNHTSVITTTNGEFVPLPDSLVKAGIDVRCIFAPEHGYKGVAEAGEHLKNTEDTDTGLKIYSLYGKTRKPQPEWLTDIDIVVFDMQDVGARFYTYLSTLKNVLEACIENRKTLMVLDRPNPNDTIDGPVLEEKFTSFVGCLEIPLLHGCTLGELAQMMLGEKWIKTDSLSLENYDLYRKDIIVIPCLCWKHGQKYDVPIAPSPNLPNTHAINLYPSLCLFEGTNVSVGRGTNYPFEVYGHPQMKGQFKFTPKPSASNKNPLQNGKICKGEDLRKIVVSKGFSLEYILKAYKQLGTKLITSQSFFDRLAGTDKLRKQILAGKKENEIRKSWQKDLSAYKDIRVKYLIYE